MTLTPSDVAVVLENRLNETVPQGIFAASDGEHTHVIVPEGEEGTFFKAVRELGLETETYRSGEGRVRGFVKPSDD